jgi:hypothetical protein
VRKKYNNFANLKLDESRVAPQNAFWWFSAKRMQT